MVISWWEEATVTKWKSIIKWWIVWFLAIVSSWAVVLLVVEFMYSID
jgi:hypothetical protein